MRLVATMSDGVNTEHFWLTGESSAGYCCSRFWQTMDFVNVKLMLKRKVAECRVVTIKLLFASYNYGIRVASFTHYETGIGALRGAVFVHCFGFARN